MFSYNNATRFSLKPLLFNNLQVTTVVLNLLIGHSLACHIPVKNSVQTTS